MTEQQRHKESRWALTDLIVFNLFQYFVICYAYYLLTENWTASAITYLILLAIIAYSENKMRAIHQEIQLFFLINKGEKTKGKYE